MSAVQATAPQPSLLDLLPPWQAPQDALAALRAEAEQRVALLGLPQAREEAWRFTDLSPLWKQHFVRAGATPLVDASAWALPEAQHSRIVFVDGVYAPHLSSLDLPDGVMCMPLRQAAHQQPVLLRSHLAQYAPFTHAALDALNTARFEDGALIWVGRNVHVEHPLHLLFVSTAQAAPQAVFPRILTVLETGSRATLVEDYVADTDGVYWNHAVSEVVLQDGACLTHARVQRDSHAAFHTARSVVSLGRDAQYLGQTVSLGARLSRLDWTVTGHGTGAHAELDGLACINGRQVADTHSLIDHVGTQGSSRQLHKIIAGGAARGVFNGAIRVARTGQRTQAAQSSRNLLLSPQARVNTKPQLEIFADDVKCAHGATVGQLDADALFYLQSRGIDEAAARQLLTWAFAAELIERLPLASLRARLREEVLAWK